MDNQNPFILMLQKYRESYGETIHNISSIQIQNAFIEIQSHRNKLHPIESSYYCSVEVAKAIVGDGKIWLCDVSKMNDSSELSFACSYIQTALSEIETSKFPTGLLKVVQEDLHELIRNTKSTALNRVVLAMCLSENEDDAPMWDRYGDSGQGVAISFNLEKLAHVSNTAGIFTPNSQSYENGVSKICYPKPNCCCLSDMLVNLLEAYEHANSQNEYDLLRNILRGEILNLLMKHKHPSFISECEVRIYSQVSSRKTWQGSDHLYPHKTRQNSQSRHSVIYLPHQAINQSEEEFWCELIPNITLGPSISDSGRVEIEKAARKRNLEDRITESCCPLVSI